MEGTALMKICKIPHRYNTELLKQLLLGDPAVMCWVMSCHQSKQTRCCRLWPGAACIAVVECFNFVLAAVCTAPDPSSTRGSKPSYACMELDGVTCPAAFLLPWGRSWNLGKRLFFPCFLQESYVKEVSNDKENMILINKADLLSEEQRAAWAQFFEKEGVKVVFWSALAECRRLSGEVKVGDQFKVGMCWLPPVTCFAVTSLVCLSSSLGKVQSRGRISLRTCVAVKQHFNKWFGGKRGEGKMENELTHLLVIVTIMKWLGLEETVKIT